MSMEIRGITGRRSQPDVTQNAAKQISQTKVLADTSHREMSIPATSVDSEQLAAVLKELQDVSGAFNKRLKFDLNKELGQVIVKVIDGNTDKVIKELPPEALQRLYLRIREAIGLLIDEKI